MKDKEGHSASMFASDATGHGTILQSSSVRSQQVAQMLIQSGADVNARDRYGRTALMFASNYEIKSMLKAAGAIE